jgi:hypothetical protein
MLTENEDYKVEYIGSDRAVVSGVLRLQSPLIYDDLFAPIRDVISSGGIFTLDITDVSFLNSSGITALARLIILARSIDIGFNIIGREEVPWQKKSIVSLKRLWPKLEVTLT